MRYDHPDPGLAAAPRQSEIQEAKTEIDREISRLEGSLTALRDKLQPVINQQDEDSAGDSAGSDRGIRHYGSPLAADLQTFSERIETMNQVAGFILARLEL